MFRNYLLVILLFLVAGPALAVQSLRVGVSADYPPLAFMADGKVTGIEADNARAVGEILGARVSMVTMPFQQMIPALLAGDVDVIMSGLSVTAERSAKVLFTDAFMQVGQMPILHRDKVARFGQPWAIYRPGVRIGVEPDTTGARFVERELAEADIRYFNDPEAAFAGLRSDQIDLYLHDAATSWQLATRDDNEDLISLYTPLTEEMVAWAVRPGDTELALELNRALAEMKSRGILQYILNRWIPVQIEVR